MSLEQALKKLAQGGEAKEREEHLLISQPLTRMERVKSMESTFPS